MEANPSNLPKTKELTMPETNPTSLTVLDPAGDLILKLTTHAEHRLFHLPPATHRIRVSSAIMKYMSRPFNTMLTGPFLEGQPAETIGPRELALPDDDAHGMAWLCHALHSEPGTPASPCALATAETVLEMLLLADKYMVVQRVAGRAYACLRAVFEAWKHGGEERSVKQAPEVEVGFVVLVALCYLGRHTDCASEHAVARKTFEHVAAALVEFGKSDGFHASAFARSPYADILPGAVLVRILGQSAETLERARRIAAEEFDSLRLRRVWNKARQEIGVFGRISDSPRVLPLAYALKEVERAVSVHELKDRVMLIMDDVDRQFDIGQGKALVYRGFSESLLESLREVQDRCHVRRIRWCCVIESCHDKKHKGKNDDDDEVNSEYTGDGTAGYREHREQSNNGEDSSG